MEVLSALRYKINSAQRTLRKWYDHRTADALLISCPKCGRTWLRLLLGRIFQQHFHISERMKLRQMLTLSDLAALDRRVPKILVTHDDDPQWKKPNELESSKAKYRKSNVILLVRDPRDVVVSLYYEQSKRVAFFLDSLRRQRHLQPYVERLNLYEGTLRDYIYEEVGSFETVLRFYEIWAQNFKVPKSAIVVRYEDLHLNPHKQLRRLLDFFGLADVTDQVVEEAIRFSSFDNMRLMEEENRFKSPILKPTDPQDINSYKTRRGETGSFRDELQAEEIAYLNSKMSKTLNDFYGYGVTPIERTGNGGKLE